MEKKNYKIANFVRKQSWSKLLKDVHVEGEIMKKRVIIVIEGNYLK
jgi:hypothetical protein